jgi:hypothetical protein
MLTELVFTQTVLGEMFIFSVISSPSPTVVKLFYAANVFELSI